MSILVTGAAGFIGFHFSKMLLEKGFSVVGYDNLNNYYDKKLKLSRIENLQKISNKLKVKFTNIEANIEDFESLKKVFDRNKFNYVVHLAAQAGVRYSLINPPSYIQSNLVGFGNILECCRNYSVKHLIFASSSSVYGLNSKTPFKETHNVDHPISLYAATKKSNELMAHAYSHLYNLPVTGLRFFTVYGPWGRPDMALFLFTRLIIENKPIDIFNKGNMIRDFTYIDDIVESIFRLIEKLPTLDKSFDNYNPNPSFSSAPYKIFNIGNSNPTYLLDYINAIEKEIGKKAIKNFLNMQPGDVAITSSNCEALENWIGFRPSTSMEKGIKNFVKWYRNYYEV